MLSASVYRFFFLYYVYTVALWLYKVDIFIIHNLKIMGKKSFLCIRFIFIAHINFRFSNLYEFEKKIWNGGQNWQGVIKGYAS